MRFPSNHTYGRALTGARPQFISGGVFVVMPAEAGIQGISQASDWIPAFAGMTRV